MSSGNFLKRGFSPREAAQYIGMSKSYLDHARSSGGGPKFIRVGGRVRYRREDLDHWLDSQPAHSHFAAEARSKKSAAA